MDLAKWKWDIKRVYNYKKFCKTIERFDVNYSEGSNHPKSVTLLFGEDFVNKGRYTLDVYNKESRDWIQYYSNVEKSYKDYFMDLLETELSITTPNEELSTDVSCEEPLTYPEGTPQDAKHYQGAYQPIEIMQLIMTDEEFKGFLKGNIIKYTYRAGKKEGESKDKEDAKIRTYTKWLKDFEKGISINPRN